MYIVQYCNKLLLQNYNGKNMKTKLTKLLLLATTLLTSLTATAYDAKVDGICYDLNQQDKTASVTYESSFATENQNYLTGDITIPGQFEFNGITYTVTSIGEDAFSFCYNLNSIRIPSSINTIGENAFYRAYLSGIIVDPDNQTYSSIDGILYDKTASTLILCPEAKKGTLTIPNSVTSIKDGAFNYCVSIEISVSEDNKNYSTRDGILYDKTQSTLIYCPMQKSGIIEIPESVKTIGNYAFFFCYRLESIIIPTSVTSIGDFSFSDCIGLQSVMIPNSVTQIGDKAFFNCENVSSMTIGNSVKSIGEQAFALCESLIHIDIPNSVTFIGESAFHLCTKLSSVTISKSISSIEKKTFEQCARLESVIIPNSVTTIKEEAFSNCTNLRSIIIGESVTSLERDAFYNCKKIELIYSKSTRAPTNNRAFNYNGYNEYDNNSAYNNCILFIPTESIENYYDNGWHMFKKTGDPSKPLVYTLYIKNEHRPICLNIDLRTLYASVTYDNASNSYVENYIGLNTANIPSNFSYKGINFKITSIEDNAFRRSPLTKITIPNTITSIGTDAFFECKNLEEIKIPSSVNFIGDYAFIRCTSLTAITVDEENKSYSSINGILYNKDKSNLICCPSGHIENAVTIPESVTSISAQAFDSCISLESVFLPEFLKIGQFPSPFIRCSYLKEFNVNEDNKYHCSIDGILYNKDATILIYCPSGKTGSVSIPNSTKDIDDYAFYGSSIESVIIPNSISKIPVGAFYLCGNLVSVIMPNSITTIERDAFRLCSKLLSIDIPDSVTSIEMRGFFDCSDLESVTLGKSVFAIGNYAFAFCTNIKSLYLKPTEPPICEDIFESSIKCTSTLYVPTGYKKNYIAASPWKDFCNIEEMDFSGIENVETDAPNIIVSSGKIEIKGIDSNTPISVYNTTGQCVYNGINTTINIPTKGIYIVCAAEKTFKIIL